MKLSVIIGVVHMTLGVFLKAGNSIYFGKWMDFVFEFIPQLAFMITLFGYMDFLIIYKWLIPWNAQTIPYAPSIITTMINMPLKLGKTMIAVVAGLMGYAWQHYSRQDSINFSNNFSNMCAFNVIAQTFILNLLQT